MNRAAPDEADLGGGDDGGAAVAEGRQRQAQIALTVALVKRLCGGEGGGGEECQFESGLEFYFLLRLFGSGPSS